MMTISECFENTIQVARSLFNRGKTAGSSANISFRYEDSVFISGTNTSFGTLTKQDFSEISLEGEYISGPKPSKEFPLHLAMYNRSESISSVIHTHSFYATLLSCLEHPDNADIVPSYTPYLKMKLGKISLVEYHKPGSEELFKAYKENLSESNGYLLANHGPIVAGKTINDAFYGLEELEESCHIAWELKGKNVKEIGDHL